MRPLPATHPTGLFELLAILCLVILGRILRPQKYLKPLREILRMKAVFPTETLQFYTLDSLTNEWNTLRKNGDRGGQETSIVCAWLAVRSPSLLGSLQADRTKMKLTCICLGSRESQSNAHLVREEAS